MVSCPISVLLADDHPIFRDGLERLLKTEPGVRVVGTAADGEEALRQVRTLHPDVLLLDYSMPRKNGIEVLRELQRDAASVRTILLTAAIEAEETAAALALDARGVILKETTTAVLLTCLQAVIEDKYWVGERTFDSVEAALAVVRQRLKPAFDLTPREVQIVGAVAEGCTNRAIATRFKISEDTVKQHLTNIFNKCGVSNRVELALLAVHRHLLAP